MGGRCAPPADAETLRRAHDAGLHVVVVTGRMFQSVRRALEPAALGDPVICYQGAVVADGQGTWLRHVPIALDLAREALEFVLGEGYSPNVYVADELYVADVSKAARDYAEFQHLDVHPVGDLLDWLSQPPTKLVCVGDPDALEGVEQRAKAHFGERMYISKSLPYFLEFAAPGVTKGAGLDFLAEHMGFTRARDDRVRRRRERRRARGVGGVRHRRRERARAREGGRRLDRAERAGRRGRTGDRRAPGSRLEAMIDLKAARNDPDAARAALARRGAADAFDELLRADEEWRALVPRVDELRAQQKLDGKPTPEQLEQLKQVKEELRTRRGAARRRRGCARRRARQGPEPSARVGCRRRPRRGRDRRQGVGGAERRRSTLRSTSSSADYDMERGAKVSGARFGFIVGDAARLSLALYRLALDRLTESGFTPVLPPVLVREEAMYGTGFFPSEKNDYYSIPEDGLYLVGTSEVPLIAMHMSEILEQLPIRYCAFSSCFRRESGSAGRDTRGMFRVHQFQKVEMVVYIRPEESWDEHERLLALEEALVQEVGLPYRVVNSAAGDLSSAAAKRYDIEAWFPSQERYREITSCSNTTDYQARRSGIRFRAGEKQLETPHTLNGTAVTDRWALAILENFGGDVPEVLQGYGAPARVTK